MTNKNLALFKSFQNRKIYELRGLLFKKEPADEKFVQRTFVLVGYFLYFFKAEKYSDDPVFIISLANARLQMVKSSNKMYQFELISRRWLYFLASKNQSDM